MSTWPAAMLALASATELLTPSTQSTRLKLLAQGETVGSDAGVEVEEEAAATEELRHPRVDLGQQTEVDLEEGPGRDPQRQPGRVDKDLARAVDRFDRALDDLGAAFRVEVDADTGDVGAGLRNGYRSGALASSRP